MLEQFWEKNMEYIDNLFINRDDNYDDNELLFDKPVGWSSVCFDQTVNYYIEHNSISNINELKETNKD